MSVLGILKKYPLAKDVICDHFTQKMIESFDSDDNIPEEFKKLLRDTKIDEENLSTMLDVNPRTLFDVFDENAFYIQVTRNNNGGWDWEVGGSVGSSTAFSRREAEIKAVEKAAELLNKKLEKDDRRNSDTSVREIPAAEQSGNPEI